MKIEEAKEYLKKYDFSFEIQDAMMGDGSYTLNYKYLLDSKAEAEQFKEAIEIVLESIKAE